MRKVITGCCAMAQIDKVGNDTPIEHLRYVLKKMSKEMRDNTEVGITTGDGQTAVFTIVSPSEDVLEANLQELGFELKHTFPRRVGYAPLGDLKMYIKNLD